MKNYLLADAILKKADASTCNELRKALQGYGLSIYGNKETLMRRLKSHHKIIKKSKTQPKSINKMAEKSDDKILEQKNVDYKKSFHCINCETDFFNYPEAVVHLGKYFLCNLRNEYSKVICMYIILFTNIFSYFFRKET